MGGWIWGTEVSRGEGYLWEPWRAYLKRFRPAPSSHWGRCTLIRCAGTRYHCMQWWVARTKVIEILLLTYPYVLEYDCFHLVARRLANPFRVAIASTPRSPSTKATKGEKCRRCWRQASRYIHFPPLSALCRHFTGSFVLCVGASVFTTRMLWKLSVPCCQRSRISRSPFCSVTSGGCTTALLEVPPAPAGAAFALFTARPD